MAAPRFVEDAFYYAQDPDDVGLSVPGGWTPAEVKNALDLHDKGDFSQSALLARDFGRDDRIPGCRASIVNGFVGRSALPFLVEPSTRGDQRRAESIAKQVFERWWDWVPEDIAKALVETYVDLGLAVARMHNDATTDEWSPRLELWPMEHVKWNEGAGRLETHDRAGNKLIITPGDGWLVLGSIQARSWLNGAVRPVGMQLIKRALVARAWVRWCEKYGNPLIVIAEPYGGDDKLKEVFFKRMQRQAANGVVRAPKGKDEQSSWGVDFLEGSAVGWEGFKSLLEKSDADISIIYTGNNLSVEVKGGSYAAANAHMVVRGDFLASVAEVLSTCLRSQLITWWGRANVESWTDALAPWPTYKTTPPETPEEKAKRLEARLTRAEKYAAKGVDVDWVKLAEDDGEIPLRSKELLPVPKPPAAEAPPASGVRPAQRDDEDQAEAA
jgi:phage gp29-like protein